jgi:hypothetical protein
MKKQHNFHKNLTELKQKDAGKLLQPLPFLQRGYRNGIRSKAPDIHKGSDGRSLVIGILKPSTFFDKNFLFV